MNLNNCSTALFVTNIELSKEFYTHILGLEIDLDFGKNIVFKNGFAIWGIRESHIIPAKMGLNNISDSTINRFELYFETDEIDNVCKTLQTHNVKFLHEIHEEIWGQQTIRFFDPDNHLIEVGESMHQFVNRFYKQGLTIEQVSERTFVTIDKIKQLIGGVI